MSMKAIVMALVVATGLFGALPIAAQEPRGFTAICTTAESRRYDSGYAFDGTRMEPEWSENENFFQPDWAFSYKGGDKIEIAGTEYNALIFGPELIFALEPSAGTVGASMWTYAINLQMKELVATQLNSSIGAGPQIKARIVTFDCKWSFHD